jgi:hypothetical protein
MRKRKPATIAIQEWIRENNVTDKSEIITRCKACMDMPDIKKLVEQYWNRIANSLTASIRDKDHVRIAFPVHSGDKVKVHNIEKTMDIDALTVIRKRCELNIKGNIKSRAKIRMRQAELAGQMTLQFIEKEKATSEGD